MRKTRTVHLVRPGDCNHYGSLFGGTAMAWMDEAAFVAATRHARAKVVTVHADALDFRHPVPQGAIVELVAWVREVGRSSMRLEVEMWVERVDSPERTLACRAGFVMVALGPDGRAIPVSAPVEGPDAEP
ncbi:MAG: acyl-CoA thioesterase [Meiothermus sp.]|uniref:acyl-CoA thioesterase n=1 Tax=Meiothermus sp. TaxID=1955249 RepID=UPI0025D9F272|nr:acyl-CoA thioesterase [Meiothermus sp.]MCS7067677.1 acyl-CoA thioesterase [Meiothermus sp.]MDW8425874.1 acyl-CoA thioesterase [Meiothermus sp.]